MLHTKAVSSLHIVVNDLQKPYYHKIKMKITANPKYSNIFA